MELLNCTIFNHQISDNKQNHLIEPFIIVSDPHNYISYSNCI